MILGIKAMLVMSIMSSLLIIVGSYWAISSGLGLMGIGVAYLVGQGIISGVYVVSGVRRKKVKRISR